MTAPAPPRAAPETRAGELAAISRPRWTTVLGAVAAVALLAVCANASQLSLATVVAGLPNIADFVGRMVPPDLSVLGTAIALMGETLAMAVTGTIIGVVLAVPTALLASRTVFPERWLHYPVRTLVNVVRAVPELMLALLFVSAVGLGALAGTLAITIATAAGMARLFADIFESADRRAWDATAATGASRAQRISWVLLPENLPTLASYTLLVLDSNVRAASLLGLVGAGGNRHRAHHPPAPVPVPTGAHHRPRRSGGRPRPRPPRRPDPKATHMTTGVPGRLANVRDLGGLPTDAGRLTRDGVLYRSGAPYPGDGAPAAVAWPPAAVVDLRSGDEPIDPHPLRAQGVPVHNLPLLVAARPRTLHELRAAGGLSFANLYRELTDRAGAAATTVLELALRADGPVLVHCAAGKDRTGVLVALLLRAAGVRRDAVVADYVRTTPAMAEVRRRISDSDAEVTALMAEFPDAVAPADAIDSVLDRVERHGGARAWLEESGTTADVVDAWRRRLVNS
ncbi:tyrosine-protein phosphatase [Pseudonocardia sp. RS010]|uniref:tyrosine-protein phosphatase n=1 Tax=Pseudonocardia sp. RS010 TaxID=3385979 RepID=UPI0039A1F49A